MCKCETKSDLRDRDNKLQFSIFNNNKSDLRDGDIQLSLAELQQPLLELFQFLVGKHFFLCFFFVVKSFLLLFFSWW